MGEVGAGLWWVRGDELSPGWLLLFPVPTLPDVRACWWAHLVGGPVTGKTSWWVGQGQWERKTSWRVMGRTDLSAD